MGKKLINLLMKKDMLILD